MITLSASAAYGFGGKQFIARITGRHPKFTFAYEFIGRKGGKRNESTDADVDTPGLYITRDWTRKNVADDNFVLIIETADGDLKEIGVEKDDAMKIAKALDDGRPFATIVEFDTDGDCWRFVTPKQAEQAAVARTIDSATDACWAVLMALPEKEAKKVLAALKVRVSPPKPVADAPVGIVSDAAQDAGATPAEVGMDPTPVLPADAGAVS